SARRPSTSTTPCPGSRTAPLGRKSPGDAINDPSDSTRSTWPETFGSPDVPTHQANTKIRSSTGRPGITLPWASTPSEPDRSRVTSCVSGNTLTTATTVRCQSAPRHTSNTRHRTPTHTPHHETTAPTKEQCPQRTRPSCPQNTSPAEPQSPTATS